MIFSLLLKYFWDFSKASVVHKKAQYSLFSLVHYVIVQFYFNFVTLLLFSFWTGFALGVKGLNKQWATSRVEAIYKSIYHILFSWPVRTLSFSYDGQMLASASEDLFIDIVSNLFTVKSDLLVSINSQSDWSFCIE